MKTQEEVVRQHAAGPISIYKIYQEGYQDRELDDWGTFRREAAKDILCAIIARTGLGSTMVINAVDTANELIRRLKEEEQ